MYDDTKQEINEFISREEKPQIVRLHGRYWHYFKNIGDVKAIDMYYVSRLYDHANPNEDERWNDSTIIDKRSGHLHINKINIIGRY